MAEMSEYEIAGRLKKCQKLTNAFVAGGFTTAYVRQMTEDDWTKLAKDLQLAKKPSQPTRDMVLLQLEQMEAK